MSRKIGIGINEDVVLKNLELVPVESKDGGDPKNSLVFTFRPLEDDSESSDNFFDQQEELDDEGYVITGSSGSSIRVFQIEPRTADKLDGTQRTPTEVHKMAQDDISDLRNLLTNIAKTYVTKDKINFKPFDNTGITRENIGSMLATKSSMAKIFTNLCSQLVEIVKPYLNKPEDAVRLLLVRQSLKKAYPTFRKKFVNNHPVMETAQIPLESSKLAFTSYEIEKGLDTDMPYSDNNASADSAKTDLAEEDVFGK